MNKNLVVFYSQERGARIKPYKNKRDFDLVQADNKTVFKNPKVDEKCLTTSPNLWVYNVDKQCFEVAPSFVQKARVEISKNNLYPLPKIRTTRFTLKEKIVALLLAIFLGLGGVYVSSNYDIKIESKEQVK